MPAFGEYQRLDKALEKLQIKHRLEEFVQPVVREVPAGLEGRLRLALRLGYTQSEEAVVQAMVFPVLWEVWTNGYEDDFQLWSEPWVEAPDLQGEPDFVVTRITDRGRVVFRAPFAAVVEAKEEQFKQGWGQCLAALVAAQKLNGTVLPVFGIVTIGVQWQFGRLLEQTLTQDPRIFDVNQLPQLCGAVRYVFEQGRAIPVQ